MFNIPNPLSTKADYAAIEAELQKPEGERDVESLMKIRNAIYVKRAARGLLAGAAAVTAVAVIVKKVNTDDENEEETDE